MNAHALTAVRAAALVAPLDKLLQATTVGGALPAARERVRRERDPRGSRMMRIDILE